MTINERLAAIIEQLKKVGKVYNQTDFAKQIGVRVNFLTDMKNGTKVISEATIDKITLTFPELNRDWLQAGTGEMLNDFTILAAAEPAPLGKKIPVLDDFASCGVTDGWPVSFSDSKYITVPDLPKADFCIRSVGFSMINKGMPELSIQPDSIVACRKVKDLLELHFGEVFLIRTENGNIIKQLWPGSAPELVKVVSFNSAVYPAYEMERNKILELAVVVGIVDVRKMCE